MQPLVAKGSSYLLRNGFERGRQGSGAWMAVAIVMVGLRVLRRMWPKEEVVWSATLAPGEKLLLEHLVDRGSGS